MASRCMFCLQVQGRILLPAAAMLEMLLATANTAWQQGSADRQRGLESASIAAPLIMTAGSDLVLSCKLRHATGQLELASGRTVASLRVHMVAQAGALSSVALDSVVPAAVLTIDGGLLVFPFCSLCRSPP